MRLSVQAGISALLFAASFGIVSAAADDPRKLPGTAGAFAAVPWGSPVDTIKSKLAERGYTFAQVDDDGDLVFTGKNGPITANVFEVLDQSKKLVKTVVAIAPAADDLIDIFRTLDKTLLDKYGKPSAALDEYGGEYRDPKDDSVRRAAIAAGKGSLGTFWIYKDGSNTYLQVTKALGIEADYESPHWKAESVRREAAAVVAGIAVPATARKSSPASAQTSAQRSANPIFVGPTGWTHTQGPSTGIGTWTRPGDTGYAENISVETKDGFSSLPALLQAEVNYVASLPDQFGNAPTDVVLCGNHPGKYISYTYTGPDGTPITSEVVIAVFGNTGYSAKYNKTITQNADAAAEHAIETLCGPNVVR